tara:strand:+ start:552 stop:1046 length:495 start_codon:yes stop_codon:yes gene_type:complete
MSGGAALIAFGILKESFDLVPAIGAIMAIISLIWVFRTKDSTPKIIVSLIRKAFSATGGALVAYGCLNPEQSEAIGGLILPIISLLSSASANGDKPSTEGLPALIGLLAALSLLSLPSCSVGLDANTGMPVLRPDTETILILSDKAAGRLNEEIADRIVESREE